MIKWFLKILKKFTGWLENFEGETVQWSKEEKEEIEDVLDDDEEKFDFHMKAQEDSPIKCTTPGCNGVLKKTGRRESKSGKNVYKCTQCGVSYTLDEQATQTVESPGREKVKKDN